MRIIRSMGGQCANFAIGWALAGTVNIYPLNSSIVIEKPPQPVEAGEGVEF